MPLYDTLVIGGGPAGLSTALGLCRALRTCVLFDEGSYRNAPTNHMHTVPTWDHTDPAKFRASALSEILNGRYSTVSQVSTSPIVSIKKTFYDPKAENSGHYFTLTDRNGAQWLGKTVVFASGITDSLDEIPGFDDAWGQSIFHCLFCHGFEERGAPSAGILVLTKSLWQFVHIFAGQAANLARKITIYSNGIEPDASSSKILELLAKNNFTIEKRKIIKLQTTKFKYHFQEEHPSGQEQLPSVHIWFEGNTSEIPDATETFLVTKPPFQVRNSELLDSLGVKFVEGSGLVDSSLATFFGTSVPGIFAAGDITTPMQTVANAIYQGTMVAGGVHHHLIAHDLNAGKFNHD